MEVGPGDRDHPGVRTPGGGRVRRRGGAHLGAYAPVGAGGEGDRVDRVVQVMVWLVTKQKILRVQ